MKLLHKTFELWSTLRLTAVGSLHPKRCKTSPLQLDLGASFGPQKTTPYQIVNTSIPALSNKPDTYLST